MVIEDSAADVQARLKARSNSIAVATLFTRSGLKGAPDIGPWWVAHNPDDLKPTIHFCIKEHQGIAHPSQEA